MDYDDWLTIVLAVIGFVASILLTLVGIIFTSQKNRIDRIEERLDKDVRELRQQILDRLRTLGHDDKSLQSNLDDLHKMFIDYIALRRKD